MVCLLIMTSSHNARFRGERDQAEERITVRTGCAARRANLAKRVECGQLAGAFGPPTSPQSGSKLHALSCASRGSVTAVPRREICGCSDNSQRRTGTDSSSPSVILV